jgi:ADP-heptose:LPS heptosyltransferase
MNRADRLDSTFAIRGSLLTADSRLPSNFRSAPAAEISLAAKRCTRKFLRDNPLMDRLIEVGTKALGRGLVSGETLRAPRQQLRQPRASAFELTLDFPKQLKFASIARPFGAHRIFRVSSDLHASLPLTKLIVRSENLHVIRENRRLPAGTLVVGN